jgi:N-acetylneuraminic acid mutarotase
MKGCAATALLIGLAGGVPAGANSWDKMPSLPKPSAGFACGAADGQLVVIGGTNWDGGRKNWLRGAFRLDPESMTWKPLESPDQPLAYALAGTIGNRLIVAGGSTGDAPFSGMIEVEGGHLTVHAARGIKVPAVVCAGGLIGNEFVGAGGSDDAGHTRGFRREAFAWNVTTGGLRALAAYPGAAFAVAGSAAAGGELLVFGGCTWNDASQSVSNFPDAYAYSAARNAWRRLRPLPYAVRGLAAVRLDDGHLYLAGGYKNDAEGFVDQAFVYSIGEDRYAPTAPLPYRGMVGLAEAGGCVYCMGGEDGQRHRSDAVYRARASGLFP